jgi:hypothetical protein
VSYPLTASGDELVELATRLRVMRRNVAGEPVCLRCDEPIAWVDWDPRTGEVVYVPRGTPGARPLAVCAAHRELESGRVHVRHATEER